jgi:hypothetical protein
MRIMFKNVLVLALALPLLSAATGASEAQPETALQTMQLSSWQSETLDGVIIGGSQAVTIVSTSTDTATGTTFQLGQPPCDCSLSNLSASVGTIENGVWTIGDLPAGATVTLDLRYSANP